MPSIGTSRLRRLHVETLESRRCMAVQAISIDINAGAASSNPGIIELNGQYYVGADNGVVGRELFRLNSDNSLTLVADIASGSASSDVNDLTKANGLLYFTVAAPESGTNYRALFRSDGTAAGTFQLMNHLYSFTPPMVQMGNHVYFSANEAATGDELYKTDGTVSGTVLVKDIDPRTFQSPYVPFDAFDSSPRYLNVFNGKLYFAASFRQRELWRSDGTEAGTRMVVDAFPGPSSSGLQALTAFNGKLVFGAFVTNGWRLYSSDGTTAGTKLLNSGFQSISEPVEANGSLYFVAQSAAFGKELWKLGTSGSAVLVKDIRPSGSSNPTQLTNFGGKLYFTANDGSHGVELWQTDGTAAGTIQVRDANPGAGSSNPQILSGLNGTLFFAATDDGETGRELWQTNGAVSGARLAADLNPGPASSDPAQSMATATELFVTATGATVGRELWRLTPSPPVMTLPTQTPLPFTKNGPVRLAPQAVLADADTTTFWGGKLSLTLGSTFQSGDRLMLVPTSNVTLNGSQVLVGGIVMGVFTTANNGRDLNVLFTQYASASRVREVLRAVAFTNTSSTPVNGDRRVRFALTDGEGGVASPLIVRVGVQVG